MAISLLKSRWDVLAWLVAIVILWNGVQVVEKHPRAGVVLMVVAVVLLPPVLHGITGALGQEIGIFLIAVIVLVGLVLGVMLVAGDSGDEDKFYKKITGQTKEEYCTQNSGYTDREAIYIYNSGDVSFNYSLLVSMELRGGKRPKYYNRTYEGTLQPGEVRNITVLDNETLSTYGSRIPGRWDVVL